MTAPRALTPLFSEADIAEGIARLSHQIVVAPQKPDIAIAVLAGAFVFAADLLRGLAREGLSLPVEFVWLRSYGAMRTGADEITVRVDIESDLAGKHVLLIDGVLDRGTTLVKACAMARAKGASAVTTAVAVDKARADALLQADHVMFRGVSGFLVGYGMDDAGADRGLPFIGCVDQSAIGKV